MKARTVSVTESELAAIPAVQYTETWAPVHHAEVARAFSGGLERLGIPVVDKRYDLSKDGKNLFSRWILEAPQNEGRGQTMLGFRNSMDKKFALGVCGGSNIVVCSNMMFTGEFVEHRRHTSGLTPDVLLEFLMKAISVTFTHAMVLAKFFEYLGTIPLPENNYKVLTFNAMEQGIIPPSHFNQFIECRKEERRDNPHFETETAQHFHGAVTRLLRDSSVGSIQDKTGRLNRLMGWGDPEVMQELAA